MFAGATSLHASRGKSVASFDLASDDPETIAAAVLGRSGTLRAPAARVGETWLIGFHEESWSDALG